MTTITHTRPRTPHYDAPDAVGLRILNARLDAGLSQRDLAFPGCTPCYLSRMERGERVGSLQVLEQIANRTGVTTDWLAHGKELLDPECAETVKKIRELAKDDTTPAKTLADAYRALARAATLTSRALG